MFRKVEEVCTTNIFCDELRCKWDMHSAGDFVMCLGDFNGHVCGILVDSMEFIEGMV